MADRVKAAARDPEAVRLLRDLVQHWDAGDIDHDYDAISSSVDAAREYVQKHGGLAGEHHHPALAASPEPAEAAHLWVGDHGVATGGNVPEPAEGLDEERLRERIKNLLGPWNAMHLEMRDAILALLEDSADG